MPEWWKVTVVYKGGATMSFVTDKFSIERERGVYTYSWGNFRDDAGPLLLGADEIAAVWQERA
jgi:hypothetical protein